MEHGRDHRHNGQVDWNRCRQTGTRPVAKIYTLVRSGLSRNTKNATEAL
jgi:hypothetical protein